METIWQDLKYALRTLAKRPGFTLVAVLTLAVGIGANTSIFSLVNAMLLEALPYPEVDRLVQVVDVQAQLAEAPASFPEFVDWRDQGEIFESIGAYFDDVVTLTGDGTPERLDSLRASATVMTLLGLKPALGRLLRRDDEPTGAARVAVLSHDLWQRQFGGDPDLVGRSLRLDGESVEVVGVLAAGLAARRPEDFYAGVERDLWLPLRLDEESSPRGLHYLSVIGRLRPGLALESAEQEIAAMAARLREEGKTRHDVALNDLPEVLTRESRSPLMMLFGTMGLVLLIGCANVANLLLARTASRRREIAVRMAMGASRWRLIRQLGTESLLLAAAAGGLGVLGAWWSLRALAAARLDHLPRPEMFTLDARVLGFTVGLSLATAVFFGLAPAWQATAGRLAETCREAGRQAGAGLGRHRTRDALVVAEVALSLMLLIGAGLLVRSFRGVMDQELGFEPAQVLTFRLYLPTASYRQAREQVTFFDRLLERLQALPGVDSAAITNTPPLTDGPSGGFAVEGLTWPEDQAPHAEKRRVSADYFRTLDIPLIEGRFFDAGDRAGAPAVAIVDEEFARQHFPNRSPIGQRIDFQWNTEGLQEIVGVVGNVRHRRLDEAYRPATYVPFAQNTQSSMRVVVRSTVDPETLIAAVRREVQAIDPEQALSAVRSLEAVVANSVGQRRLATQLLSGFATVAMLLAALGIYGVMSYSTAQRKHEMGVRMALGARRWGLVGLVMSWGMKLATLGVVLGLGAAFGLTRYLSASLFGVAPTDPVTFIVVVSVLLTAAASACYLPARRAARVDPVVALRGE